MNFFGDKVNYSEIGRTGSPERFAQTLAKVSGSRKKILSLCDGAIEALDEGRPENIQILFQTLHKLGQGTSFRVLYKLTDAAREHAAAVMAQAFATTPETIRKEVLTNALAEVFDYNLNENEKFIETVIKNGADANVAQNGFHGALLARAVVNNASPKILDMLSEYGADANGALNRAYSANQAYSSAHINTLKLLKDLQDKRAQAAKKPQDAANEASDEDVPTMLKQIQENIRDLTAAVGILAERIDAQQAAQKKPQDKTYPKI